MVGLVVVVVVVGDYRVSPLEFNPIIYQLAQVFSGGQFPQLQKSPAAAVKFIVASVKQGRIQLRRKLLAVVCQSFFSLCCTVSSLWSENFYRVFSVCASELRILCFVSFRFEVGYRQTIDAVVSIHLKNKLSS